MEKLEQNRWIICYFFLGLQCPWPIIHAFFFNGLGGNKSRRFGLLERFFYQLSQLPGNLDSESNFTRVSAGVNNLPNIYPNSEIKKDNRCNQETTFIKINITSDIYCEVNLYCSKTYTDRDILVICWTTAHESGIVTTWEFRHICPRISICSCSKWDRQERWEGSFILLMWVILDGEQYLCHKIDNASWTFTNQVIGSQLAQYIHKQENQALKGISCEHHSHYKINPDSDLAALLKMNKVKPIFYI